MILNEYWLTWDNDVLVAHTIDPEFEDDKGSVHVVDYSYFEKSDKINMNDLLIQKPKRVILEF